MGVDTTFTIGDLDNDRFFSLSRPPILFFEGSGEVLRSA